MSSPPPGAVPLGTPPGAEQQSKPPAGAIPIGAPPQGAVALTTPTPKPTPTAEGGLSSVNPGVNVIGDWMTKWTTFAGGGITDAFRGVMQQLVDMGNHLGIYDFDKGHHYAPNDPHLEGRAGDVDTINGESVGVQATPGIKKFISQALQTDSRVRLGVPAEIYKQVGSMGGRIFVDAPAHIHVEYDPVGPVTGKVNQGDALANAHHTGAPAGAVPLGAQPLGQPSIHSGRIGSYGATEGSQAQQSPVGQFALGPLTSMAQTFNSWFEPLTLNSPVFGGLVRSGGDLNHIKAITVDMWNTFRQAKNPAELTSAMQAVDDKYGLFSPQNVAALYRSDPGDPIVKFLHEHPTIDDVGARTIANLIGVNPLRLVSYIAKLSKLDKVAKAAGAIAMKQPHIAKVVKGAEQAVNPHALLRQVDTDVSTPDEREQAGRTFKNSTNRAVHSSVQEVNQEGGLPPGLTKPQRVEIARRSQNQDGVIRNVPNESVPQPSKKIGKSLDDLAAQHREWIKKVTAEKVATGQLKPGDVENVETHLPLGDTPFGMVHTAEGMGPGEVRDSGVPGGMGRKSIFSKGVQQTEQRRASGIISELQANKQLSSRYDPYIQSLNYIIPTRVRDQLTRAADAFNRTGLAQDLTYRDVGVWNPETKTWEKQDVSGEVGQQQAKRWATQQARGQARGDVRSQFEQQGIIAPGEDMRSMAQQRPQYAAGKGAQAERSVGEAHQTVRKDTGGPTQDIRIERDSTKGGRFHSFRAFSADGRHLGDLNVDTSNGRFEDAPGSGEFYDSLSANVLPDAQRKGVATALYNAAEESLGRKLRPDPSDQTEAAKAFWANRIAAREVAKGAADRLFGPGSPMAKKAEKLSQMAGEAKFNKQRAMLFAQSVNRAAKQLASEKFETMQSAAEKEARASGYTPGRDVTAVPMASHMAVPENTVKFLKNEGASSRDALGAGGMISGFTDLYRMGIITNPVRHVFWNLGMNFLAATGGRGIRFFNPAERDSLWRPPDPKWEKMADENNATIYQNAQHPIFGGHDLGTMTQTPLKKVYGEAKDTFGGGVRGAAKGAGAVVNAAATRAWQLNQKITFDLFEHRYAVQLFKDMVEKQGMTPAKAGIAVRKTLGDYLGVSASGIENTMKQVFLFYPWMKTVIPFQAKQLLEHPQFVTGPYGAIHRWNQHRGDPNVDHESPGAIYIGTDPNTGKPNYATWPGPQKDVVNLMESVSPSGDVNPQPLLNEAVNHLNPILGMGYDVAATQLQEPSEPNPAFHVAYQKNAPTATKSAQFATSEFGRVPFAQLGEHTQKAAGGLTGAILNALTINTYDRPSPGGQHVQGVIEGKFNRALASLNKELKEKDIGSREFQLRRVGIYKMQKIASDWADKYGSLNPDDKTFQDSQQKMSDAMQAAEDEMNANLTKAGFQP